ncbi:MAG: tyrosine-type recombinase/integrase [Proteobacteria bacterium]|nr:tyrosine-type recombinase/integrase [Pseudomonadota bacterium]MBU1742072.1 tyrosine-type recombinase/integrase [Pseudomonadota bacterium]
MDLITYHPTPGVPELGDDDLIHAFLSGRSERTIRAYRADLENFAAYLGVATIDQAAGLLLGHGHGGANRLALAYKNGMVERMQKGELAPATLNHRLTALRSLVKLARTLGRITWALDVENVKHKSYRDTKGPGRANVTRMLDAVRRRTDSKGVRDYALLRLLYDLGLRRSEATGLDLADLDLEAGTVAILGKGRHEREALELPAETKAVLTAWVEVRGQEPGPLFTNMDRARKGDGRLTGRGLYRVVATWGGMIGVRVRPHGLRHSAITAYLDLSGGDLRGAQAFGRHANASTTMRYDDNRTNAGAKAARLVAASV